MGECVYIVRGKDDGGALVWTADEGGVYTEAFRGRAKEYATIDGAVRAWEDMRSWGRHTDVRIYAVAEDGTETPLPTYEEALAIVDLARRLIRSADLKVTTGPPANRARIDCDDEPRDALAAVFFAEEEAARTIPGLVCSECDRNIYRGSEYAGRAGDAAHKACRNWPAGTTFRKAGDGSRAA